MTLFSGKFSITIAFPNFHFVVIHLNNLREVTSAVISSRTRSRSQIYIAPKDPIPFMKFSAPNDPIPPVIVNMIP